MLAAYTFKGRHNLLFRKADSKTLGDLLEGSPHSPFRNLEQMILAISGLSSALQAVHNFHFPDLEILAIGCHHDLKPDNILVHEGSFLLADFGLSTIKDSRKASYTSFKNVRGDYVAPECENFEELSKRNVINRASDIWSLGCIILELLVFTVLGPDGVTDFELERGFKIGDHKRYRFHHGFGVESPAVALKLDQLQNRLKDLAGRDLLILSREMLNLYPKRRPSAIEVEEKMQFVTIQVLCEDIHQRCSRVLQISRSMQAWLILSKFVGWMEICKLGQHGFLERWHPIRFPNYQLTRKCLQNMQGILTAILPDCESHLAHIYRPLHDLNHTLYEALPNDLRDQAEVIFKSKVLDNVDNSGLDDIANNTSIPRNQAVLCVMARVRLLSALVDDDAVAAFPELKIDPSFLKKENPGIGSGPLVGRRALGFLQNGRTEDRRVLIESKEYAIDISEPCLREYVNRLSTLTKLLQEAGPGFRILPCSGYYHDPGRDICGLVFEYPPSPHPASELQFTTLKAGLDQYYRKPMPYLALENRFQLAYDLAVSLQNFHEAEWLHKKISSFNVGFFHHKDEPWLHVMGKPYFIGFMHSRPSGRSAYSEYFEDPRETDYQHPEYLEGEGDVRYRLQFDYYSLGLILLEIGRWETLEHMREKFDDREDMREKLRYDKIRRLGQSMGSIYQRATAVCLGDELRPTAGMENSANEDKEIRLKFSDMVVRQLARCTV
ncbi:MAG: hypothetical protein L6R41_001917 [Letrouitia leprolyta]|nr:MAG: hypothetical protein L6R41_001917 [Letrouitia leprolyta]